jgi:nucleoside-diphosphate-sugar epimerase
MRAVTPRGQAQIGESCRQQLRGLTRMLIDACPDTEAEHARFRDIGGRALPLPADALASRLDGGTVLVTGGTGCIGSALLAELAVYRPARLASVSRGRMTAWPRLDRVEYHHADIRDREALDRVVGAVQPDVIFHLAAQRDPGLAESQVHRTLTTNILGTRNVLASAEGAQVPQVVCASTGKALRPYSPDVYTASKRAAEWIMTEAARTSPVRCSAARFTHVIDNSIVYRRLLAWAGDPGATIRLHSPDSVLYVQSARESAQLLLLAFLGTGPDELRVHAIKDLGWPVSLLDLTLAILRPMPEPPAVYFSGHDAGYEEVPFPGLYDPLTAGDVSPLLNAFEAAALTSSPSPHTDAFRVELARATQPHTLLADLTATAGQTQNPELLRPGLDALSWALLDAALRAAPSHALARSAALAKSHWDAMRPDHRRILEMIIERTGAP